MAIEVEIKSWGNSAGVIIPKEVLKARGLKVGDKIVFEPTKVADLRHLFGILPRKISGQALKNAARKGWEPDGWKQ